MHAAAAAGENPAQWWSLAESPCTCIHTAAGRTTRYSCGIQTLTNAAPQYEGPHTHSKPTARQELPAESCQPPQRSCVPADLMWRLAAQQQHGRCKTNQAATGSTSECRAAAAAARDVDGGAPAASTGCLDAHTPVTTHTHTHAHTHSL